MKQQIIFIHGWVPKENFSSSLECVQLCEYDPYSEKKKRWRYDLETEFWASCDVIFLPMPNRDYADYVEWKIMFEKLIPYLRDDVILIGHSLGGSFLFKYISENTLPVSIKALFSLWWAMTDNDVELLWSFTPHRKKISDISVDNLYLIHSRDDDIVPFSDFEILDRHLSGNINMIFEDRGHFLWEEFPEIIEALKKIL